jgi:hypothetical protein
MTLSGVLSVLGSQRRSPRENSPFGELKLNPTIAAIGVFGRAGVDWLPRTRRRRVETA